MQSPNCFLCDDETIENDIVLTDQKLNLQEAIGKVSSKDCGATSVFIGTTRDVFDGKSVVHLEYECYHGMAKKEILKICQDVRRQHPQVKHISIHHRLGTVPLKESSVIIATSAPHRRDAINATAELIDRIKTTVPIWKKERYADGSGVWMENNECAWSNRCSAGNGAS